MNPCKDCDIREQCQACEIKDLTCEELRRIIEAEGEDG